MNNNSIKTDKFLHRLLLGFFIFLLASCAAPKDLVYKDFQNLKIEKVGFAASLVKLELLYYNPNNFGLQLKRTDLDIFLDDSYLGHTAQEYQVSIPKRGDFVLPVQIDVDMKNIFKNALNSFLGKEVKVKVIGTVKVGKANVFKSFQVNYEGLQKISIF